LLAVTDQVQQGAHSASGMQHHCRAILHLNRASWALADPDIAMAWNIFVH
jgi:hypothetical protein